jgi:hypothetical protein
LHSKGTAAAACCHATPVLPCRTRAAPCYLGWQELSCRLLNVWPPVSFAICRSISLFKACPKALLAVTPMPPGEHARFLQVLLQPAGLQHIAPPTSSQLVGHLGLSSCAQVLSSPRCNRTQPTSPSHPSPSCSATRAVAQPTAACSHIALAVTQRAASTRAVTSTSCTHAASDQWQCYARRQ